MTGKKVRSLRWTGPGDSVALSPAAGKRVPRGHTNGTNKTRKTPENVFRGVERLASHRALSGLRSRAWQPAPSQSKPPGSRIVPNERDHWGPTQPNDPESHWHFHLLRFGSVFQKWIRASSCLPVPGATLHAAAAPAPCNTPSQPNPTGSWILDPRFPCAFFFLSEKHWPIIHLGPLGRRRAGEASRRRRKEEKTQPLGWNHHPCLLFLSLHSTFSLHTPPALPLAPPPLGDGERGNAMGEIPAGGEGCQRRMERVHAYPCCCC